MFQTLVNTQNQALCHLLFHCCMKDGNFQEAELNQISEKMVLLGLDKDLDFKKEVIKYQQYRPMVNDEKEYLRHIIELISPVNDLALLSYCTELMVSDGLLEMTEETLVENIANALHIDETSRKTITKLAMQRKVIETGKIV
ncbi:MAG: TerB family tellurite resistance protein [Chitinophagaceae bacterium]|nr:TerB family tellurite resistance protein [Chitinophagaceae bacterium]